MSLHTYDDLTGPELDADLWKPLELAGKVRLEPEATTTVSDGVVTVDIPRFTASDPDVQGFDNCKHVIGSTRTFPLPATGVASFQADVAVARAGGDHHDYRLGAAAFNVTDSAGSLIYDVLSLPERVLAEHETLGGGNPFTWVIDAPFVPLARDGFRTCRVELEPAAGRATWSVDGRIVYEARGLTEFPDSVTIGFAFFTLVPIASGEGSVQGQGARASWRGFRYDVPGAS